MKLFFWVLLFITLTLPVQVEKLHCPNPGTNDESNREIARRRFHMGNTYVGKNHRLGKSFLL